MLARIRQLAGIEILIVVGSTIFGLLIGPLLEKITSPLFDTPNRAILTSISLVAVLTMISVTITSIVARQTKQENDEIHGTLEDMKNRAGTTVRFVYDPPNISTGEVYRAKREIIEKAEKEILILHYSRNQDPIVSRLLPRSAETQAYQLECDRYVQALEEKVQLHRKDKFFYRAIFQFAEGESVRVTEKTIGPRWINHTTNILNIVKEYPECAYIKKSPLFFRQQFVIVDERYLIWTIHANYPDQNASYVEGALFVDDPNKDFISHMKSLFQRIDTRSQLIQSVPESS